ncbi:hypothetical protein F5148DRAFT_1200983 [Russula earlei]|uniref:Uncharacterized protein n=1 Tax=Russula earlei TaxID=71964 RepID=A0ACC0U8G2_9AGAM|nr:hypothetical protein F5148DRAFT_1200983 [Russula earlei]
MSPPSDPGPSQSKISEPTTQLPSGQPLQHAFQHPSPLQATHIGSFPYYGHPTWNGQPWQVNGYQYNPAYQQPYPQIHPYQLTQFHQYQLPAPAPAPVRPAAAASHKSSGKRKAPPPSPSPSPSPSPPPKDLPRHWDAALKAFFLAVGLSQCLAGLEADILVMNPDWERKVVPTALSNLQSDISRLLGTQQPNSPGLPERSLEERKLDYVHVEKGAEARSPTAINRSIAELLARNRARNDASNRAEFLHAHRRLRSSEASGILPRDGGDEVESASCARTDARTVDRDVMMKFDIAKNEEGPLSRTLKVEMKDENNPHMDKGDHSVTASRHPGLDERLKNLEAHLAMRYVPSPPASLLHRIKFVEDHIIQLERDYPPWAALHFNQPRRGWPPPPRPTPVIVPSHFTSNPTTDSLPAPASAVETSAPPVSTTYSGKAVTEVRTKGRASRSSLHRAVLEKLEVQRAIEDLKGEGEHC